jgi:hypothetical protein
VSANEEADIVERCRPRRGLRRADHTAPQCKPISLSTIQAYGGEWVNKKMVRAQKCYLCIRFRYRWNDPDFGDAGQKVRPSTVGYSPRGGTCKRL